MIQIEARAVDRLAFGVEEVVAGGVEALSKRVGAEAGAVELRVSDFIEGVRAS